MNNYIYYPILYILYIPILFTFILILLDSQLLKIYFVFPLLIIASILRLPRKFRTFSRSYLFKVSEYKGYFYRCVVLCLAIFCTYIRYYVATFRLIFAKFRICNFQLFYMIVKGAVPIFVSPF